MKRRNFIGLATAGAAAVGLPTIYYQFRDIKYAPSLAEPQSLSHIWDTDLIVAIGERYRLQVPEEKTERGLVKLLKKALPTDDPGTSEIPMQHISKDFESGNTVVIDGWVLSVTEARQCALFSLLQTK